MIDKKIISQINDIISTAEEMRGAYFFTSPSSASSRRWYEKKHSCDRVEWDEGGNHYSAEFITICSCKNVYAYGKYFKNGNKTTLTAIRNSKKRLEEGI